MDDWARSAADVGNRTEGTQSIHRAFLVLRVLATVSDSGLGLTDIARASGLTRPTSHRVLKALMAEGAIEQRTRTRRYAIGKHIQISPPRPATSPLLKAAIPQLDEAAAAIGDTLFLTIRSDRETLCIARHLGSYPIQVPSLDVGVSRPLGVSSAGIAVLATMKSAAARRIVLDNRRQLMTYGLTVEDSLAAVGRARALGYALRDRGLVPGTRAVSVAFGSKRGEALAALTVAGIARRLYPQRIAMIVDRLRLCAARIEQALKAA